MRKGSLIIPNSSRRHCCPFPQGPGPHGGTHPPVCDWEHMSSNFLNSAACMPSQSRPQYWATKMVVSAVDKIWCSLWLHAGCCESVVRGFLACLAGSQVTFYQFASPERALFRTKGFCGASG